MPDAIKVHLYDDTTLLDTRTVDGGGNWSKTGQSLSAGAHQLKGKAEDLAGNISGFSTIKKVYTGSTTTPVCDLLDDTGESSTDNVTNDDTPRIRVYINLQTESVALGIDLNPNAVKALKLQKSTDGGNNWSDVATETELSFDDAYIWDAFFYITTALPEGEVKFRALWQDQKNDWSATGPVLTIIVDTTAPNAPAITSPENGQVFVGTSIDIAGTAS